MTLYSLRLPGLALLKPYESLVTSKNVEVATTPMHYDNKGRHKIGAKTETQKKKFGTSSCLRTLL